MIISKINTLNNSFKRLSFKNDLTISETKPKADHQNRSLWIIGTTSVLAAGVAAALIIKNKKKVSVLDVPFKDALLKALEKENIKVKPEALKSIVGPDEFSELIKNFKPEHFQAGLQTSKEITNLEKYFENSVKGDFRISLHTHSNFSDGKATVEEFLDCATRYADKVAKLNKNDNLPPFTIALTDHDCVDGCREVIKIIAQNPEKYKNLKFVSGCEFSVKNGEGHHDVTGLALNPFEKGIRDMLENLRSKRKNTIEEFIKTKNNEYNKKITLEDLIELEKETYELKGKAGKCSIENGSGIVYVRHAVKFYYKAADKTVDKNILNKLGNKDILPIETVLETINKTNGYASLTHPIKSFWKYIGDEELLRLKNMGIKGIETNHQYTSSKIQKLGEKTGKPDKADEIFKEILDKYKAFANKHGMFHSGGTDCHEKQIFSRFPNLPNDFLENKILK